MTDCALSIVQNQLRVQHDRLLMYYCIQNDHYLRHFFFKSSTAFVDFYFTHSKLDKEAVNIVMIILIQIRPYISFGRISSQIAHM